MTTIMLLFTAFAALFSLAAASTPMGNLAVVIRAEKVISTEEDPVKAKTGDLWCQATKDGQFVDITWARFIRLRDRKIFPATIDENAKKARLIFDEADVTHGSKYRCEMRLEDGELVHGNMFAYVRPVLHVNSTVAEKLKVEEEEKIHVIATEPIKVESGETAQLNCPVLGYPVPNILWYKDMIPLDEEENKVYFENDKKAAFIMDFDESDVGRYRCVATNQFPVSVDGPEQEFELKYDQHLELASSYGWITPLMVILIILLLVFIIIYGCQACKRYKSDDYNVARRENNMRQAEEQCGLTKNCA